MDLLASGLVRSIQPPIATSALTLLQLREAGSNVNHIDFIGVEQTGLALVLVVSAAVHDPVQLAAYIAVRFNNDLTAQNHWNLLHEVVGGPLVATAHTAQFFRSEEIIIGHAGRDNAGRQGGSCVAYIPGYAGSVFYKQVISTASSFRISGASETALLAEYGGTWRSFLPINRVSVLSLNGTTFAVGSTFSLYKIGAP